MAEHEFALPDQRDLRALPRPLLPHGASCAGSQNRESDKETR